jgi:hypothetical protein
MHVINVINLRIAEEESECLKKIQFFSKFKNHNLNGVNYVGEDSSAVSQFLCNAPIDCGKCRVHVL